MGEPIKASEEMKKFFEKFLSLKKFVQQKQKEFSQDENLKEIYNRLDEIIKEGK